MHYITDEDENKAVETLELTKFKYYLNNNNQYLMPMIVVLKIPMIWIVLGIKMFLIYMAK